MTFTWAAKHTRIVGSSRPGHYLHRPPIFQTGRTGNIQYLFYSRPKKGGHWYDVRLYFAESTFQQAGKRRFDVVINGKTVLKDFDIFQEAGGANKALLKDFPLVSANQDGTFEIKLQSGSADHPAICGIELIKTNAPEPPKASATPKAQQKNPHP